MLLGANDCREDLHIQSLMNELTKAGTMEVFVLCLDFWEGFEDVESEYFKRI